METNAQEVVTLIYDTVVAYFSDPAKWRHAQVAVTEDDILPEVIPHGGWVNVIGGDPGEPDEVLGGFKPTYYQHAVEIDLMVSSGDPDIRKKRYGRLVAAVGAALDADRTLGGKVIAMQFGQPAPNNERIIGGEDLKAATLVILIDYVTSTSIPPIQEETEDE